MFKYKISVIVPVYNSADFIHESLDSLLDQKMRKEDFEVLLVDDGSVDSSAEICKQYTQKYSCFKYFYKENGGVSSTRNYGIDHAQGKYLLFLDSDDTITKDVLCDVYSFFEKHCDETDMVTYKIVPMTDTVRGKLHYRYGILDQTAVYDLTEQKNWYITQTTMNICVKNFGETSSVRFDTKLAFHEDQDYICNVLGYKMKIGYCDGPEYHYQRHLSSVTGTKTHAYYIFEDSTALRERLFSQFDGREIPKYFQAFCLHDLNWKFISDLLLPYHYTDEKYDAAVSRLLELIDRIDDDVIMNHPKVDLYHKVYALGLKKSDALSCMIGDDGVKLFSNNEEVFSSPTLGIVVNKIKVVGKKLLFDGIIKNPVLSFCEKPEVSVIINGVRQPVAITDSTYDYYHCRMKTSVFWRIRLDFDIETTDTFRFEIVLDGHLFEPVYYFMPFTSFKQYSHNKNFFRDGRCFSFSDGIFRIRSGGLAASPLHRAVSCVRNFVHYFPINPRIPVYRAFAAVRPRCETWLYADRYGVFDNAYEQFRHDSQIKDGISRYYVLNSCDLGQLESRFSPEEREMVVIFHSMKHKYLYLSCEKIITSFSNLSNLCPFGTRPIEWYSDLTRFEVVYLQHGILHASLLAMYAKERCQIDRIVVSSHFEVDNLTGKYGYSHNDLIESGMPRYDFTQTGLPKKNRILFSPSWRSNLIGKLVENNRVSCPEVFLKSDFYREVNALLNSQELSTLLEKNDLYLDFKNHPIFSCYNDLFSPASNRITVSCGDTKMNDYSLMITDYSSIVFDAVYLDCPIVYFVPDYDKFVAGVSHNYHELDLPLEKGFGPFTQTAQELIQELRRCVADGFIPHEPYLSRMNGFFLHRDGHNMDRLYDSLKNSR